MSDIELPAGYGQIIYDGFRKRAQADLDDDMLTEEWNEIVSDHQACWNGAADDLAAYLDRVPR
jgi:hypothetical protein